MVCVSVTVSSSPSSSCPAATVTVCAVFHAAAANVSDNVASAATPLAVTALPSSALSTPTVTGPPGRVFRRSVYVFAAPSSASASAVGVTSRPGVSSSVTVTVTAATVSAA